MSTPHFIERNLLVDISASATNSVVIDITDVTKGSIQFSEDLTGTGTVTYKVSNAATKPAVAAMFQPYDNGDTAVPAISTVAADECHEVPPAVMAFKWLALTFGTSQTTEDKNNLFFGKG
jgi:hypothetical protein